MPAAAVKGSTLASVKQGEGKGRGLCILGWIAVKRLRCRVACVQGDALATRAARHALLGGARSLECVAVVA
jgi:hypothetical protein